MTRTTLSFDANEVTAAVNASLAENGHPVTNLTANYVKHKQNQSTLIGLTATCPKTQSPCVGHALRVGSSRDADRIEAKSRTFRLAKSRLGVDLARIDAHTLVWGFPNDPLLRRLRWLTSPRKLKRTFAMLYPDHQIRSSSTSEVLSYKPQRRLVARINLRLDDSDARDLVVRYTGTSATQRLLTSTVAFREAGINVAPAVGTTLNGHALVTSYLPGSAFTSPAKADPKASTEAIVELMAQLPEVPLPRHGEIVEDGIATRRASELHALRHEHPAAVICSDALATAAVPQTELRPSHGDMKPDNLIITNEGLGLIDLERAQWAPSPFDLTTLLANIEATGLRTQQDATLADALTDHAHSLWDISTVSWHRAAALIGIATRWQRQLSHAHHIGALLEQAAKHLRAATS